MPDFVNTACVSSIPIAPTPCQSCGRSDATHFVQLFIPTLATSVVVEDHLCEGCAEQMTSDLRAGLPDPPAVEIDESEVPF